MSRPTVVIASMLRSPKPRPPQRRSLHWHLRAGWGAVHSIRSRHQAMHYRLLRWKVLIHLHGASRRHGTGAVAKSLLEVSSPVAKARAAALTSDCAWVRATSARAVASPVWAEAASVNVPT